MPPTGVDRSAPVVANHEIGIGAPRAAVWQLHADVNSSTNGKFADTATGVHVTTTKSFAGDPVEADRTNVLALLDQSLSSWLQQLKAAAENG